MKIILVLAATVAAVWFLLGWQAGAVILLLAAAIFSLRVWAEMR